MSISTSATCAPDGKVAASAGPKLARSVKPVSMSSGNCADWKACRATSSMPTARSVPAIANLPASKTISLGAASMTWAAILRPLSISRSAAVTIAEPASCAEREPKVPMPIVTQVAVAVAVADLVGVDAELFRQDLFEGRAVSLAVIHAAGDQHDPAGRIEADLGMLVVAPAGRRDRRRDADAEQLAPLACFSAAGGDPVIGGEMPRIVEGLREIAAGVRLPPRGRG